MSDSTGITPTSDTQEEPTRSGTLFGLRRKPKNTGATALSETLEQENTWEGLDIHTPRGAVLRNNPRAARRGAYAPRFQGAPTTTRQGGILNPALLAQPSHTDAIAIGNDKLTRSMVAHDPFSAYHRKEITSPSVIILGIIGSGKSSLLKTVYVARPIIMHKRRVIVADRKDQNGEGEYGDLVRSLGSEPFKMLIGSDKGGTVLNVLDPNITAVIGQHQVLSLIRAMIERADNGQTLTKWENEALRVALSTTLRDADNNGRVPVLSDLIARCGRMDGHHEWDDLRPNAQDRMHEAGLGLRFVLNRTISEEMEGLFDGPTSAHVNLASKLTSFDISQLPENSPAAGMVMAIAQTWALGRIRQERGWATYFCVEEGWDMISGPIGRALKAQQLLARGLGLATVTAMHHIRQVAAEADGREMLQEPQTIHLFRQEREEDVAACIANFGLDPQSADTLRNQPEGHHLLKIGTNPEIPIEHIRSTLETHLTDTDAAMIAMTRKG